MPLQNAYALDQCLFLNNVSGVFFAQSVFGVMVTIRDSKGHVISSATESDATTAFREATKKIIKRRMPGT